MKLTIEMVESYGDGPAVLAEAMYFALEKQALQVNKHDGEPYVLQLARVAQSVSHNPHHLHSSWVYEAVAWLHDIIEDTDVTFQNLEMRFPIEIATAVEAMSKRAGETNEEYYHRVSLNHIATIVKLSDIADNFGRNHLIEDDEKVTRLAKKYSLGLDILQRVHHG